MIDLNHVLIAKRPEWVRKLGKVILLQDNAPAHKTKSIPDIGRCYPTCRIHQPC